MERPLPSFGAIRVVHPFPSVLDGVVVSVVALVAGGPPGVALRLGVSMLLLQLAIGGLNDLVDAPLDAGRKPGKPIPAGLVTARTVRLVVAASVVAGLVLALASGPLLAGLAAVVLAIGATYDLRAKGTTLSWLPLAVGIPILPVYGWLGATGALPGAFLVLVPMAACAGAALAVSNAMVDLERDAAAGVRSVATALGLQTASRLVVAAYLAVVLVAAAAVVGLGAPAVGNAVVLVAGLVPIGGGLVGMAAATRAEPSLRERAWEIQAVGAALLAIAWLWAVVLLGRPG